VILANEVRGDDAHGMAWVDSNGRVQMYKRPGSFKDNLQILNMAADARVIICHMRKTTMGPESNNINNHPHICDNGWFVHNGCIRNYGELLAKWGVMPVSECDTEVLGLITTQVNQPPIKQWQVAINEIDPLERLTVMALYNRPARLVVARRGNPLSWWKSTEGFYFASMGNGFPHRGREFRDNQIVEYSWTRQSGGNRVRAVGVRPYAPFHSTYQGSRQFSRCGGWQGGSSNGPLSDRERALLETEYGDGEVADYFNNTLRGAGCLEGSSSALPSHYQDHNNLRLARKARSRGKLMEQARAAASGKTEGRVLVTPPPVTPEGHVEGAVIVRGTFDGAGNPVAVADEQSTAALDEIDFNICPRCEAIIQIRGGKQVCDCRDTMEIDSDPNLFQFDDEPPPVEIQLMDPDEMDRLAGG
jgi:predicted glutamine amidotransferase